MTNQRPSTYGEHAELAAGALTRLTAGSPIPVDTDEIAQLLRCRDAVIDALRQRLYDLAVTTNVDNFPALPDPWLPCREEWIPVQLARIAAGLPRLQEPPASPPSEALGRRSMDVTVDLWRTAAIESLAASAALSSRVTSWTVDDPKGRWLVLRDTALQLEAVSVLDVELREIGLLNQHDAPGPVIPIEDTRAVLAQATRMAEWRINSDAVDHLASPVVYPVPREATPNGAVCLVRSLSDLIPAQERLAKALKPLSAHSSHFAGEPHISSRVARFVTTGQLLILSLSEMMDAAHPSEAVNARLGDRLSALSELDRGLAPLTDLDPGLRMAGTLAYLQQTEITTAVHRLARQGRLEGLSTAERQALEDVTASVCRNFALSLRRELLRDDSNLRLRDSTGQIGPTRVWHKSPISRLLLDVVRASTPTMDPVVASVSVQRAVLRHTLDTTPTVPTPRSRLRTRNAGWLSEKAWRAHSGPGLSGPLR